MPIIKLTATDIEIAELLQDWRHDRISRWDAVARMRELTGWSKDYVERMLDAQWLPSGRR
jgi:hypothetical protein